MRNKKWYRCENKSYTWCKSCVMNSNFKDAWTDEEYKQMRRKEKMRMKPKTNDVTLEELIPQYASNKAEMEDYKKICDKENAQIKEMMLADGLDEKEAGGYIAKRIVQHRETMNEAKLLEIAHQCGIPEIVKTKEYIDFDALESAIYNNRIPQDILLEMDKAKEVKEVVTLKVSKIKKKEKE